MLVLSSQKEEYHRCQRYSTSSTFSDSKSVDRMIWTIKMFRAVVAMFPSTKWMFKNFSLGNLEAVSKAFLKSPESMNKT